MSKHLEGTYIVAEVSACYGCELMQSSQGRTAAVPLIESWSDSRAFERKARKESVEVSVFASNPHLNDRCSNGCYSRILCGNSSPGSWSSGTSPWNSRQLRDSGKLGNYYHGSHLNHWKYRSQQLCNFTNWIWIDTGWLGSVLDIILVSGNVYAFDYTDPTPAEMTAASADMLTAFSTAAGLPADGDKNNLYSGDLTGQTLVPGTYVWTSAVGVSAAGSVTISGTASDVWVFQIAGDLSLGSAPLVTLSGALPLTSSGRSLAQVTLGTNVLP